MIEKLKGELNKHKFDMLFIIIVILIATALTSNFSLLYIQGNSMYPTYSDKQVLVIKKEREFKNNDIAVFAAPFDWSKDNKKFIKRIIAIEGDNLSIEGNSMKVNGVEVASIEDKRCDLKEFGITIEKGEYFMVGDNYSSSNDSLTQLCNGNENFLVEDGDMLFSGKEVFVIGGF